MIWRSVRWWLAGVIAYLVFLLAMLPATYVTARLQRQVPQIQFAGISGSVWSGAAQDVTWSGDSWGQARWQFDWAGLFTGHLGYRLSLQSSDMELRGRVAGDAQHLLLRDVQGHLDVQRLEALLPLPSGTLSGELQLQLQQVMLLRDRPTAADGLINLAQVALHWPQPVTLGSYQIKLATRKDSGIEGTLLDTSGPLALQGSLRLQPDGHYDVSGTLASRDGTDTTLNNLLHYLPADASGNHRFSFSGQW